MASERVEGLIDAIMFCKCVGCKERRAALVAAIDAEVEEARQQGRHSMVMECQVDG